MLNASDGGEFIYRLICRLFPECRSLTGAGVRRTLALLGREISDLVVSEIPSGTKCLDWTVPDEWNVHDAFVVDPEGERILEFSKHNLHLMGYSLPFEGDVSLEELNEHLYSLPNQPDVIPYVTSYYSPRWGFCLSHRQREALRPGLYRVKIETCLSKGSLTYGEAFLPGEEAREVLLSTYICHPSLANDNLSGPALLAALWKWLAPQRRRFSYRFVFVPETIGAIVYISRHLEELKARTEAGFVLTCVGDDRGFSFLPSRKGHTLADRVGRHVLRHAAPHFKEYSFLDRGSDERQYCSPGVDLPVASVMRSKYGTFPEYHTSADDLDFISPEGLRGSFDVYRRIIETLEHNRTYRATCLCEPQLGKRGLYPTLSMKDSAQQIRLMMNLLALSDGDTDLLGLAEEMDVPFGDLYPIARRLEQEGLLEILGPCSCVPHGQANVTG